MDCVTIPIIAALAASGVQVSQRDQPDAPRGAIAIARLDADGSVMSERSQSCSSLAGCTAPIQIGRPGLDRIRLVVRPDGGEGVHLYAVVEDGRGRELDASAERLCWRSSGLARGELLIKPLREPREVRGLRSPRPEFDESAEAVTLMVAVTPGF